MKTKKTVKTFGQIAFETWIEVYEMESGETVHGIRTWDDCDDNMKSAWESSAEAVFNA